MTDGGSPPARWARDPLPWRTHVALTIVSLGVWLIVLPALLLWHRQRREAAVLWGIATAVVVVLAVAAVTLGSGGGRSVVVLPADPGDVAVTGPPPRPTPTTGTTGTTPTASSTTGRTAGTSTSTRRTRAKAKRSRTTSTTTAAGATTTGTTASSTPATTTATTTVTARTTRDPRFLTCVQAKAAGYGPYRRGVDPEYWWYWDFERDGVVCD